MARLYHIFPQVSLRKSCYTLTMISRDVLYYTIAAAVAVGMAFWVWLLWYIIKIFKSVEQLIGDFRDRLHVIDEILRTIHDKLTSTHTQLSMLAEGVTRLISFFNNRRATKRGKTSTRASAASDDI